MIALVSCLDEPVAEAIVPGGVLHGQHRAVRDMQHLPAVVAAQDGGKLLIGDLARRGHGGRVVRIPLLQGRSTSRLLEAIRKQGRG